MEISKASRTVSLILKAVVIVSAIVGIILSAKAGEAYFMGGSTVFMYFTVQSNIAIAIVCAIGGFMLLRKAAISNTWYVIKFVLTVAITLTGFVFCFVLAPTLKDKAWNVQNILTHVVVPLCSIIDFFVTGVYSKIKKFNVIFVTIPPLLYAIYAAVGFVQNWRFSPGKNYPYFFLNWGSPAGAFGFTDSLPYMGTAWWIVALLIFLIVIGFVYLGLLGLFKKLKH